MTTLLQGPPTQARGKAGSTPTGQPAGKGDRALLRANLRSSAVGAVVGAVVVAVLAAIDPTIPWWQVGLRSAAALVVGAAAGLGLTSASHLLRDIRERCAAPDVSGSARTGAMKTGA
ncbi:MAG: hypothetical protein ACRDNB_09260 [Gaiellaceae bacterium]